MQSPHPDLAWPTLDPAEAEHLVKRLGDFASHVITEIDRWRPRVANWFGRSSHAHRLGLDAITETARRIPDQLLMAGSAVERLATATRDAQDEIRSLAVLLSAAEATARRMHNHAAEADGRAATLAGASSIDPTVPAEAERLRAQAAEARRRAESASRDLEATRRSTTARADELVESLRRADALAAASIDTLLAGEATRRTSKQVLSIGVRPDVLRPDDRDWIPRRIEETRRSMRRYVESLTSAVAELEAVSWQRRSWSESMAIIHLTEELELHRRFLAPGRQMLDWEPAGDGRAVEVFGDLTTARHIAVMVPGIMNTIENFDDQLATHAEDLWVDASNIDPETAVIAWLGYDTPELLNAVSKERAQDGENELRALLESLPEDAHLSVVAHSYGTVLTAEAAATGLAADDIALVGSPGTRLDDIEDARLRPGAQVFAGVADTDWLVGRTGYGSVVCPETILGAGWLTGLRWVVSPITGPISWVTDSCNTDADGDVKGLSHGINPAHEDFGAIEIATDGIDGHSDYFDPGTSSLEAIAEIVTGTHSGQH